LSELAYWAEAEMLVFSEFDLQNITPTHVKAKICGSRVTVMEKHIKAVTYHNLEIVKTEAGLTATVVFDV
jgi:SHS2 domain-containing protein